MTVRDALVRDPRTLEADTPIREAAELLLRPHVRSAFVVAGGQLLGAVSVEDLVAAIAAGRDLPTLTVADVCHGDLPSIDPDVSLELALQRMAEQDIERLAVVQDGRLLGTVSREPILQRLAEDEPPSDGDQQE